MIQSGREGEPLFGRLNVSRLSVGVVIVILAGTQVIACSGEPDGAVKPKVLVAQRDPGGRSGGKQPDAGEQPGPGERTGGSQRPGGQPAVGPPPWLQPKSDCTPQPASIYVSGIILDLNTGAAKCSRDIIVCSTNITSVAFYNYRQGGKCPWAEGTTIAFREDGAPVCCAEWEKAKLSASPCDPRADADCDGIRNDDDVETLRAAARPPG